MLTSYTFSFPENTFNCTLPSKPSIEYLELKKNDDSVMFPRYYCKIHSGKIQVGAVKMPYFASFLPVRTILNEAMSIIASSYSNAHLFNEKPYFCNGIVSRHYSFSKGTRTIEGYIFVKGRYIYQVEGEYYADCNESKSLIKETLHSFYMKR